LFLIYQVKDFAPQKGVKIHLMDKRHVQKIATDKWNYRQLSSEFIDTLFLCIK